MNNYQPWEKYHGRIVSSRGGWKIGSGIQNCGYDMMNDLVGKTSYMQVVVLNATGRLPSKAIADWIDAIHICLSWPDPRIWCNRIGALAGSSRASGVAASCLGVLAAESTSYGIKPLISGVDFWGLTNAIDQSLLQWAAYRYNQQDRVQHRGHNQCILALSLCALVWQLLILRQPDRPGYTWYNQYIRLLG